MITMKQHILTLAAGLLCLNAAAQIFNPTVEVTNTFEGSYKGIEKPAQVMAVPDSVMRFDLTFDYSVSDNPYRGAYDFEPYMVNMKPQGSPLEKRRFFLRAGAGWTLHPELELVYAPQTRKGLDINLYARHNSYFGPYRSVGLDFEEKTLSFTDNSWEGYRSSTRAGVDGRYSWNRGVADFNVCYRNLMTKDNASQQSLNGGEASLSLRSTDPAQRFLYELGAKIAADAITAPNKSGSDIRVDANGAVGVRIGKEASALLGFDVQYDVNTLTGSSTGAFAVIPQYRMVGERGVVRIGVKLSALMPDTRTEALYKGRGQWIYPDVYLSYVVLPDLLVAFASATGGDRINSFSMLGARNSFFPTEFGIVQNTVERFNIAAGLRAGIASRLQLSVKAGLAMASNEVWDALASPTVSVLTRPAYVYVGGMRAYAQADAYWVSDKIVAEAHATGTMATAILPEDYIGLAPLMPPLLQGNARIAYIWKNRIQGGVSGAFSSGRSSTDWTLPGWIDLGVFAEMAVSRRFTVWARGGNLLNQAVYRVPTIAEKGPSVTAGVQFCC